jgi:predicted dehydrogenase
VTNVGLVGYGYWGRILTKTILKTNKYKIKWICDSNPNNIVNLEIPVYTDLNDALSQNDVDLVIVTTPASTHFQLSKTVLEKSISVLVTKPVTLNYKELVTLVELASRQKCKLFADHTFLYSDIFVYLENLIIDNRFGKLNNFYSNRSNLGKFQKDASVIEDLMIHDIYMVDRFIGELPITVYAIGNLHQGVDTFSSGTSVLVYKNGFTAFLNASWLSPIKVREVRVTGSKLFANWIDNNPEDKKLGLFEFDSIFDFDTDQANPKTLYYPKIAQTETLLNELTHINDQIRGTIVLDYSPLLRVAKIIDTIKLSISTNSAINLGE